MEGAPSAMFLRSKDRPAGCWATAATADAPSTLPGSEVASEREPRAAPAGWLWQV